MSTTAISIKDVQRTYGTGSHQVHALKRVSLTVERGQFVALKGRSGSGKTTLLNCIGGLDQPSSGTIQVDDFTVTGQSEAVRTRWRKQHVGFIFQAHGLLPSLSAYENVELMLRISGMSRPMRKSQAVTVLEQVGLGDYIHSRPYELSGGQAQRVAIARALAIRPKLILADEATGELDTDTTFTVLTLFRQLCRETGLTILMATHDDLVESYVDRTVHLQDGEIQLA